MGRRTLPSSFCQVEVVASQVVPATAITRCIEVDTEIMRCGVMNAIKHAMKFGDQRQYTDAKNILERTISIVKSSVSYRTNSISVRSLVEQMETCKLKLDRQTFEFGGGRAFTSECYSVNSKQRCGFGKTSACGNAFFGAYQT